VALSDDVGTIAGAAAEYAAAGEEVVAVIAVETHAGERVYLCAFDDGAGMHSWLALAEDGKPVTDRRHVRDAASIAALAEVAEEAAGVAASEEPRLASLAYVDSLGGAGGGGDLAGAVQAALPAVDELTKDIEVNYKLELE
jgi:hypothetical protein